MTEVYTSVDRIQNFIAVRGYVNGKPFKRKDPFRPTLYVRSNSKDSTLKALDGTPVDSIQPGNMYECSQFAKRYDNVDNFKIYGNQNYIQQYINEKFGRDLVPDRASIRIGYVDIEVQSDQGFPLPEEARYPVTAITVKISGGAFMTWGCGEYDPKISSIKGKKVYVKCEDERDLLVRFLGWWLPNCPDVVTGWNSRLFDIPYLVNRVNNVLGEKWVRRFSPWANDNQFSRTALVVGRTILLNGKEIQLFEIRGVQQLDYLDLFKKFAYYYGTQETYKLDHIGFVVLGERKLDYSEYGSLNELYAKNHQKFIDYNIRDCDIVERLETKLKLIEIAVTIAYVAKVNFSDAFGPVALWDAIICNALLKTGVVIPPREHKVKERANEGAYVKHPAPGLYKWICSFDVDSLYPSILQQYNISPETFKPEITNVDFDQLLAGKKYSLPQGTCISALGFQFRTDIIGIIPSIVRQMYATRVETKQKMIELRRLAETTMDKIEKNQHISTAVYYDNQQQATKILMNSLYGALSNEFFRYFDLRLSESVTITGQLTIRWAEQQINKYLSSVTGDDDYVCLVDTDSCYVVLDKIVEKYCKGYTTEQIVNFLDKVCEQKLKPLLNKCFQDLGERMGCVTNDIRMKREAIVERGVITGKKHYILSVWDQEGVRYSEPKIKMTGVEAVRSSTPQVCRDMLKDIYKEMLLTFDQNKCHDQINQFRDKFDSMVPEDIAFPRGISNLDKYQHPQTVYKKGTPVHVRGALMYNNLLEKYGVANKYERINNGTKVKWVYLRMPNPIHENVIAFPSVLPKEFGIEKYIDYNTQFHKSFLGAVDNVIGKVGWTTEPIITLDDLFA